MMSHVECGGHDPRIVPLRLLMVGQSHVQTLRFAVLQNPELLSSYANRPVRVDFLFLRHTDACLSTSLTTEETRPFVENWLEEPERFREYGTQLFDEMDHIVVLWPGAQLSTHMTLAIGPEFDVILPDERDRSVPTGVEIVPTGAVEELIWATLEKDPIYRAASALIGSSHAVGKLSFLAPPPPLPIEAVRERLAVEPFFTRKAEQLGIDLTMARLVPDCVRVKVWKVLVSVYKALAEQHGARLILPPTEAADEIGTLASDYWSNDVTHANRAYGRLYIEKILSNIMGGVN
jgi:hypothetical protein